MVSCKPMKKDFISALQKQLQTPQKIVVIPHKNPDGDALGSTLAWMLFLQKNKHDAVVISPNDYPDFLKWMPAQDQILIFSQNESSVENKIQEADLIFTLDFNSLSRIDQLGSLVAD